MQIKKETEVNTGGVATAAQLEAINAQAKAEMTAEQDRWAAEFDYETHQEDLKKAKDEPQRYKSLRVRVSGYSDFFVNLAEPIQDDIIKRTVHSK